jgi:hypothetical protein
MPEIPTVWSEEMLNKFIDLCLHRLSAWPGRIPIFITDKSTHITISHDNSKEESIGYQGILAIKGLEGVNFFINSDWASSNEHKDHIGYIELLDGVADDLETPVPMIRGSIKRNFSFWESIDIMSRDAKIFGWNNPIGLNIHIPPSYCGHFNSGNILRTELGIQTVEFRQNLTVFERDDIKYLR